MPLRRLLSFIFHPLENNNLRYKKYLADIRKVLQPDSFKITKFTSTTYGTLPLLFSKELMQF